MRFIIILFTVFICSCTSKTSNTTIAEFNKPIAKVDSVAISGSLSNLIRRELCTKIMLITQGEELFFSLPSQSRKWLYKIPIRVEAGVDSLVIDKQFQDFDAYYSPGNQLVYTLDLEKKQVNTFRVDGDSLYLVNKVIYTGLSTHNRFFVSENFKILPIDHSLAVNYLLWKGGSKSYTDTAGLIIADTGGLEVKALAYPEKFKKERVYSNYLLYDADTSGNIVFTFESYDSLFIANSNGAIIKRGVLHHKPMPPVFNAKKEPDLAYVRKYQSLAEKNVQVEVVNDRIVTIKKLSNENILNPVKYKYFVHDYNLKLLYADTFRVPVTPGFIGMGKNSFIMLNNKLDKAYFFLLRY